jgi:tRNA(Ile)-lysidine synthase
LAERFGLARGASLIVAYSGGLDSHVLLHLLAALRAEADFVLRAVHVDHALQPASADWAEHCRRVCAALSVPCQVERLTVVAAPGEGLESAARRARYGALARHLASGEILLTAHHRDDQAETVLLQLLRGAGVHGLRAMPAVSPFGAGWHWRPLLAWRRRALEDYARRHGLEWIEDASNLDTAHARNFLRQRVLPLIETRWPAASDVIARSAEHAAEAAMLLDQLAREDLVRCRQEEGGGAQQSLSVGCLRALEPARQRNLLRFWIRASGLKPPPAAILDEILAQGMRAATRSGSAVVHWPGGEVRRYRDRLSVHVATRPLAAPSPSTAAGLELLWEPPAPLVIPGVGRLRAEPVTGEGLARARLEGRRLRVRFRRGGETCRLGGHRRRLKKLLQEAGIPPWERARLPLVYAGEELVAVGDRWICDGYAALEGEPGWRLVIEPAD